MPLPLPDREEDEEYRRQQIAAAREAMQDLALHEDSIINPWEGEEQAGTLPGEAVMDFSIDEVDPGPELIGAGDPGPLEPQPDLQSMAVQSLQAGIPERQNYDPEGTNVPFPDSPLQGSINTQQAGPMGPSPAEQYLEAVREARSSGQGKDMLSAVVHGLAQRPLQGPRFADIRGGARGMDLVRQMQMQREQRRHQAAQAKADREAEQRAYDRGFREEARDYKRGRDIISDERYKAEQAAKVEAAELAHERNLERDRLRYEAQDRLRKRKGGGGRRALEVTPDDARDALIAKGVGDPSPEDIEQEIRLQKKIGRKRLPQYFKELGTGIAREQRTLRKEERGDERFEKRRGYKLAESSRKEVQALQNVRDRAKRALAAMNKLSDAQIRDMLVTGGKAEAIGGLTGFGSGGTAVQETASKFYQFFNPQIAEEAGAAVSNQEMARQLKSIASDWWSDPAAAKAALRELINTGQGEIDRLAEFGGRAEDVAPQFGEEAARVYTVTKPDGTVIQQRLKPSQAETLGSRPKWKVE